jgi:hypothetical protein
MGKKVEVSKAVQEAEAALEVARTELAETKGRLADEKGRPGELVKDWVKADAAARVAIESEQGRNQLALVNLAALFESLTGEVQAREQALRESQRSEKVADCLARLGESAEAADRIRMGTKELLEAHCFYQQRKIAFEGARNALRRVCPGGNLDVLQKSEAGVLIARGPKLAPQLRSDLVVYDRAERTLAVLESSGALKTDEAGWKQQITAWTQHHGIGPRPPSFKKTRVFKGKW